jgi:ligand-binding SRPBCC domain-containing protein
MKLYFLQRSQLLPIELKEAWQFFSNPENLELITPAWLGFKITSQVPEKIYSGLLISYQVTPILGIHTSWVTEISLVKEPYFFVDEQKVGPYQFWRHQHIFKQTPDGVEMRDIVYYALPLAMVGQLVHKLVVRQKLEEIFDFRYQVLEEIFGRN